MNPEEKMALDRVQFEQNQITERMNALVTRVEELENKLKENSTDGN